MNLLSLLLAIQIFTLPTIPEALEAPADRALFLAEHYWDNTPLSDTLINEHAEEYEQFLVDYLSILPLLDTDKQTQLLRPFFAYSAPLLRQYLCHKDSPIFNQEMYDRCLLSFAQNNSSQQESHRSYQPSEYTLLFYYQDGCKACQDTMEELDRSSIITQSIEKNWLKIQLRKTTYNPHLELLDDHENILLNDISVEELEMIFQQN